MSIHPDKSMINKFLKCKNMHDSLSLRVSKHENCIIVKVKFQKKGTSQTNDSLITYFTQ